MGPVTQNISETYSVSTHDVGETIVGERTAVEAKNLESKGLAIEESAKSPRKTLTTALGLGTGFAGHLTVSALIALLLFYIIIPVTLLKQQRRARTESAHEPLHSEYPAIQRQTVILPPEQENQVPVTRELFYSFQVIKEKHLNSILVLTSAEEWGGRREQFMSAVKTMIEKASALQEGEAIKLDPFVLAMDLMCLENEVAKAQIAIQSLEQNTERDDLLIEQYQKRIEARRRQRKAAELWEAAVQSGSLGNDESLKSSLSRLLAAVRSRAVASEHFTLLVLDSLRTHPEQAEDLVKFQNAEAGNVYEAVASLCNAGQIAASDPLITSKVGNWLPLMFALI